MDYHPTVKQIIDILITHTYWHETFTHPPVTTSEEAAKTRPGYTLEQGAKALIIKMEKRSKETEFCMLVLPAHLKLDSKKIKSALGIKSLRFASEDEILTISHGVQKGAIPPFGSLFGIKVYVDPLLFSNEKIVFNAGDRRFSIAMKSEDYRRIVLPQVLDMKESL
jgi:prolyl-tRNA editing enzyme YbaK/EbsC (Cys-tRNA(Pro) deacylase)